ncbi:unnamed protein product, partial [Mesorhabditis belari]|uniref:Uncharacterized protein n=1 Tax=Mesorhabditis belari TaxID=2138241 RepID=A0AAF3FTK0_9BILA
MMQQPNESSLHEEQQVQEVIAVNEIDEVMKKVQEDVEEDVEVAVNEDVEEDVKEHVENEAMKIDDNGENQMQHYVGPGTNGDDKAVKEELKEMDENRTAKVDHDGKAKAQEDEGNDEAMNDGDGKKEKKETQENDENKAMKIDENEETQQQLVYLIGNAQSQLGSVQQDYAGQAWGYAFNGATEGCFKSDFNDDFNITFLKNNQPQSGSAGQAFADVFDWAYSNDDFNVIFPELA